MLSAMLGVTIAVDAQESAMRLTVTALTKTADAVLSIDSQARPMALAVLVYDIEVY